MTLLSVLIPLSIPDQADHVNNIVAIIINITCVPKLFGTLNRNLGLHLFEVHQIRGFFATPVTVAITANTSIAPPIGPFIDFSPNRN